MCPCHNCLHPFRSSLCSLWRPCCSSDQATSGQPGILRRWSYGVERLAARHPNCFLFNYIQESTQDSLVYPVLLCNLIRVSYAVRHPCSDFMDMLRRLTSCRIIIIIIPYHTIPYHTIPYPFNINMLTERNMV